MKRMGAAAWTKFLSEWEREELDQLPVEQPQPVSDDESAFRDFGLLRPPATEVALRRCEERLGVALPKSYRSFLRASNGALLSTAYGIVTLLDCDNVGWLAECDPPFCEIYSEIVAEIDDSEYQKYGRKQDEYAWRSEYVPTMLRISEETTYAYYWLNPKIVSAGGEWEAYHLSCKDGAAIRERSFEELLARIRGQKGRRAWWR